MASSKTFVLRHHGVQSWCSVCFPHAVDVVPNCIQRIQRTGSRYSAAKLYSSVRSSRHLPSSSRLRRHSSLLSSPSPGVYSSCPHLFCSTASNISFMSVVRAMVTTRSSSVRVTPGVPAGRLLGRTAALCSFFEELKCIQYDLSI